MWGVRPPGSTPHSRREPSVSEPSEESSERSRRRGRTPSRLFWTAGAVKEGRRRRLMPWMRLAWSSGAALEDGAASRRRLGAAGAAPLAAFWRSASRSSDRLPGLPAFCQRCPHLQRWAVERLKAAAGGLPRTRLEDPRAAVHGPKRPHRQQKDPLTCCTGRRSCGRPPASIPCAKNHWCCRCRSRGTLSRCWHQTCKSGTPSTPSWGRNSDGRRGEPLGGLGPCPRQLAERKEV